MTVPSLEPTPGSATPSDFGAAVGGAFFAAVLAAATFRISTFDVWWHLASGRLILSGHGIPRADVFSFTAAGHEWVDHEWLFQCLIYGLHEIGGPPALIALKALLVAVAAALVFSFVRRDTGLPPALVALVLLPFIFAGRNRFVIRPELFTVLFAVLTACSVYRRRRRAAGWRELFWVPALFVLWANLHGGGTIVGLAMLGLFTVGRALETATEARFNQPASGGAVSLSTAVVLTLTSAAAGLVNPYFHRVYEVPFRLTALIERGPFLNAEWSPPRFAFHHVYFAAVALAVSLVVLLLVRRRPIAWSALLPLVFVIAISLRYVRNLALFGFLAPVLLAAAFERSGGEVPVRWAGKLRRSIRPAVVVALLIALGASLAVDGGGFAPGFGIDTSRIPVAATEFITAVHPPGNLLNAYPFGGYATWRLYPGIRIFIDGRNEVFADLRAELAAAVTDNRLWSGLLERYSIGYTLLAYIDRPERVQIVDPDGQQSRIELRPYAVNHFPPDEWALVYWDDTAMIHVRRTAASSALIERYESAVQPEDPSYLFALLARGEADPIAVEGELLFRALHGPGERRARRLLTALGSPTGG